MSFLVKLIVLIITLIEIIYFICLKEKKKIFFDERFWIFAPWTFCLFVYCFSGIKYVFNLNIYSLGYIILYWLFFFIGYKILRKNTDEKEEMADYSVKLNLTPIFFISLIGIVFYLLYMLSRNSIKFGVTRNVDTNFLSTICLILSCSSLIIWLYEFSYSLLNSKKMTIMGILSCIIYNIPGILISGRDSLSIFLISSFVVFNYCTMKKNNKKYNKKLKRKIIYILILTFVYLIFLTNNRYGRSSKAALEMFEWSSGVKFPSYIIDMYKKFGGMGKVFVNFLFYYTAQFSKFSLMFNSYNGPYLYGFFELHYISRLLPANLGLDYSLVSEQIEIITKSNGLPGLKVFWDTAIGYMIFDYGRVGALIVSFIYGLIIQKISSWSKKGKNIIQIISQSLICTSMFITIEFSPLFDYFLVFPMIWIIVLNLLIKKKRKENEYKN